MVEISFNVIVWEMHRQFASLAQRDGLAESAHIDTDFKWTHFYILFDLIQCSSNKLCLHFFLFAYALSAVFICEKYSLFPPFFPALWLLRQTDLFPFHFISWIQVNKLLIVCSFCLHNFMSRVHTVHDMTVQLHTKEKNIPNMMFKCCILQITTEATKKSETNRKSLQHSSIESAIQQQKKTRRI